jgi:hypothetical protein
LVGAVLGEEDEHDTSANMNTALSGRNFVILPYLMMLPPLSRSGSMNVKSSIQN